MRRTRYLIIAIIVVAALNVAAIAAKVHAELVPATLIFPRSHADRLMWPTNNSWMWSIRPGRTEAPSDEPKLTLLLRRKRDSSPNAGTVFSPRKLRDGEVTHSISYLGTAESHASKEVLAAIQLLDQTELTGEPSDQPLRMRISLSIGLAWSSTLGPETLVPGSRFLGCANHLPRWEDDELHLTNVFIKTEQGADIYDLVLVRS